MSPKERFQKEGPAKQWLEITGKAVFQQAIDAALLEMQHSLGAADLNAAAAHHFRMNGALVFSKILAGLAEKAQVPIPSQFGNLTHK